MSKDDKWGNFREKKGKTRGLVVKMRGLGLKTQGFKHIFSPKPAFLKHFQVSTCSFFAIPPPKKAIKTNKILYYYIF
ncbi:hypothetical protein IKQ19_16640 [Candidatus Saccharibacteria bacterium]|nr:hypothetical protein [Candidatus Saccharibacteria bacterium]